MLGVWVVAMTRKPNHPRYGVELVYKFAPCEWCCEESELKEFDHESGEVSEVCARCFDAATQQDERERLGGGHRRGSTTKRLCS